MPKQLTLFCTSLLVLILIVFSAKLVLDSERGRKSLFDGGLDAGANHTDSAPVTVTVRDDTPDAASLAIQIDDFTIQQVKLDNETFNLITVGTEPTISRAGWPDLPFIARCVLIPPQSSVQLEIGEVVSHVEYGIRPPVAPRETDGVFEQVGEAAAFQEWDGFWPPEPLVLGEPAILRGWRLINFRFYPVQYNRSTGYMRFNDRIEFDLVFEGSGENIVLEPGKPRPSIYAHRVIRNLVENPPPLPEKDDLQGGSYLYIVPQVDGVPERVERLIEWRWRQGHRGEFDEWVEHGTGSKYVRRELLDVGFNEVRHWYHNENGDIGGDQPFLTDCIEWGISIPKLSLKES